MSEVATGLAVGNAARPELAAEAVHLAMQKLGDRIPNGVLLFLTEEFAADPQPAIRAAAAASSCLQVMGCSAPGIFTEQDWVLDTPAAAAMVFSGDVTMLPKPEGAGLRMALTAPNALNTVWLQSPASRFGGVSGDATGQGPFSVWQHAKGTPVGHCEAAFRGVNAAVLVSHGLRILTSIQTIDAASDYDLLQLNAQPALPMFHMSFPDTAPSSHLLMAMVADSEARLLAGDFQLAGIVSENAAQQSLTLTKLLRPGQVVCWGVRAADAAEAELHGLIASQLAMWNRSPAFGLFFSCLGRGPYLYNGMDRDLDALRLLCPGMPLIGFYGNGEIAPHGQGSELLEYSAVLGLFAKD